MAPKKIRLSHGILLVLLASCGAATENSGRVEDTGSVASRSGVTVAAYCEKFAREYSKRKMLEHQDGSTTTGKRSDVMMLISNVFQPSDSRFTAEYDCRFRARDAQGRVHDVSVGVFLTKTLHFARYTQWERLQIVPIAYVVDGAKDRAGYGVFKYLEGP